MSTPTAPATPPPASTLSTARVLRGDTHWPFVAYVIGDDLWIFSQRMTCFGGCDDPEDNGDTASGVSTKDPAALGISLPMDGRMYHGLSAAEHEALDGSPIPRIPWHTPVEVFCGGVSFQAPLIDLGPGHRTGNAVDATLAAARKINPAATSTDFAAHVCARVIGGAQYAPKA